MSNKFFPDRLSDYSFYEEINWKSEFLECVLKQLLSVAVVNSERDRQKFTELLNGMLSYRMGLISAKFASTGKKL
jgi:hypothetical protein